MSQQIIPNSRIAEIEWYAGNLDKLGASFTERKVIRELVDAIKRMKTVEAFTEVVPDLESMLGEVHSWFTNFYDWQGDENTAYMVPEIKRLLRSVVAKRGSAEGLKVQPSGEVARLSRDALEEENRGLRKASLMVSIILSEAHREITALRERVVDLEYKCMGEDYK